MQKINQIGYLLTEEELKDFGLQCIDSSDNDEKSPDEVVKSIMKELELNF